MTHFRKSSTHRNGFLRVEEKTASFSFGSRGSNSTDGLTEDMDRAIEVGAWRRVGGAGKVGKEEIAGSATASVGKDKVCSIRADGKDHIAGMVAANRGIRVCRQVIEKHVTGFVGVFGGSSLTVGNFVQRDNDGGIATTGVIEEETGDLLHMLDTEFVEKRGNVLNRKLNLLTVHGGGPEMRGMLRFEGRWMTQGEKCQIILCYRTGVGQYCE